MASIAFSLGGGQKPITAFTTVLSKTYSHSSDYGVEKTFHPFAEVSDIKKGKCYFVFNDLRDEQQTARLRYSFTVSGGTVSPDLVNQVVNNRDYKGYIVEVLDDAAFDVAITTSSIHVGTGVPKRCSCTITEIVR